MKPSRPSQIVTTCPKCANLFYVPSGISVLTIVRCPKCKSEYSLESVLPDDVQELEIVGLPDHGAGGGGSDRLPSASAEESTRGEATEVPLTKFEVPAILKQGAKRRSHRSSHSERPVQAENGAVAAGDEMSTIQENVDIVISSRRPSSSSYRRHSRSSRSSRTFAKPNNALEIAKIVFGALLAIPVAQLVIWWGLGVDPLKLGPPVGRAFPALVPKALRGEKPAERLNGLDLRETTK